VRLAVSALAIEGAAHAHREGGGRTQRKLSGGQRMPSNDATRWNERYRTGGGNSSLLLARGMRVIGVDVSEVTVRRAKVRLPRLNAVVADLTRFVLPTDTFDVILTSTIPIAACGRGITAR
jgi:hypothetical protein